jgi:hypothetical protein
MLAGAQASCETPGDGTSGITHEDVGLEGGEKEEEGDNEPREELHMKKKKSEVSFKGIGRRSWIESKTHVNADGVSELSEAGDSRGIDSSRSVEVGLKDSARRPVEKLKE